jgi:hypothetical protein
MPACATTKLAVVQHQVARQALQKGAQLVAQRFRVRLQLLQGALQPVRDLHLAPAQVADKLLVVVADDGVGDARLHHPPRQLHHADRVRSAVDQVADEDRLAPVGVRRAIAVHLPAQQAQQVQQLVYAAMHIADDVEGSRVGAVQVGAQGRAHDGCRLYLLWRAQHIDIAEPLALQLAQRPTRRLRLSANDALAQRAVGARGVALQADRRGQRKRNRDGNRVVRLRQLQIPLTVFGVQVRRVDNREFAQLQPLGDDGV